MPSLVRVVEATYAATKDGDIESWLAATVRALTPVIGEGRGTLGYTYDATGTPSRWSITTPVVDAGPPVLALAVTSTFAAAPSSLLAPLYRTEQRVVTASELQGCTMSQLPFGDAAAFAKKLRVDDILSLHAGDASGRGAIFGAACAEQRTLRAAERWRYSQLAAHLAAACRLVQSVARIRPAATFDASGRVLDARGAVRGDLSPLRAAVRNIDRARAARTSADESLSLWPALVEGRYSLIDRFEDDGKRFVVAYENPPGIRDPRGLTRQERAVAGLLSLALADKIIAYELGLGEGTVRAHVHTVLRKLGVRSRAELVSLFAAASNAVPLTLDATTPEVVVFEHAAARAPLGSLSDAERAVVELTLSGASRKAIAAAQRKSLGTVAKQLASAYTKLGVGSRAELAALVHAQAR